jgi:hypothetical protein
VDLKAWNLEKLLSVGNRDAPSGQPPRKKRKLEDLDNDLAAMIHDEGEEGIDGISANGYGNENCNAHTSCCGVCNGGRAAKYREEYEQNIGLKGRGTGPTVFEIFVNYSAQQYCIYIHSTHLSLMHHGQSWRSIITWS